LNEKKNYFGNKIQHNEKVLLAKFLIEIHAMEEDINVHNFRGILLSSLRKVRIARKSRKTDFSFHFVEMKKSDIFLLSSKLSRRDNYANNGAAGSICSAN
jgi:hypothetical protein